MKTNEYQTKDLYEASLLYTLNYQFLGLTESGQYCLFRFEDKASCQGIVDKYWAKAVKVDAKSYAEAIRTLKERLFSRK